MSDELVESEETIVEQMVQLPPVLGEGFSVICIDWLPWVSTAVTPFCTDLVHWEASLAQCAQGRGISVGFQRKDGGGICYASEIIPAPNSQWTVAS